MKITIKLLLLTSFLVFLSCSKKNNITYYSNQKLDQSKWNTVVVPAYDAAIVTLLPVNWSTDAAYKKSGANFQTIGFIPESQTVDNWDQMLSVTSHINMPLNPKQHFIFTYVLMQKMCGAKNTSFQIIEDKKDFLGAVLMCGKKIDNDKKISGNLSIYRIYKIEDTLYSISYTIKGKEYNVKKDAPAQSIDSLLEYYKITGPTMICNLEDDNSHSCNQYLDYYNAEKTAKYVKVKEEENNFMGY